MPEFTRRHLANHRSEPIWTASCAGLPRRHHLLQAACLAILRELRAALLLIRETAEELAPPGSLPNEEYCTGQRGPQMDQHSFRI